MSTHRVPVAARPSRRDAGPSLGRWPRAGRLAVLALLLVWTAAAQAEGIILVSNRDEDGSGSGSYVFLVSPLDAEPKRLTFGRAWRPFPLHDGRRIAYLHTNSRQWLEVFAFDLRARSSSVLYNRYGHVYPNVAERRVWNARL